jgi:hypothetical protein
MACRGSTRSRDPFQFAAELEKLVLAYDIGGVADAISEWGNPLDAWLADLETKAAFLGMLASDVLDGLAQVVTQEQLRRTVAANVEPAVQDWESANQD